MNLEALKTYTTRYTGKDGKERAMLTWDHYEQILAMIAKRDALARHMLKAIGELGRSPTARIDARAWLKYYTRRARRLGIEKPPRGKSPIRNPKKSFDLWDD